MSEFLPTNEAIITETPKEPIAADQEAQADETQPPMINEDVKRKKKRGSFGILKAALLILRKNSITAPGENKEKKKSLTRNGSSVKGKWTKLVGSMRPLHMQETTNSPPRPVAEQHPQQQQLQQQEAIVIAPASPAPSSSCGTISTYASASSLRELYSDNEEEDEEEEDPDQVFDAICGDEMIDAKAEEFIAQFYKQIQLQNSTTAHHHHHHHRRN